jgi:hypothetical protein
MAVIGIVEQRLCQAGPDDLVIALALGVLLAVVLALLEVLLLGLSWRRLLLARASRGVGSRSWDSRRRRRVQHGRRLLCQRRSG